MKLTGITPLFKYLTSLWGCEETSRLFQLYNVGSSPKFDLATVFWQVDVNGYIRTGKIMKYGSDGHRIKTDGVAAFSWAHCDRHVPNDFTLVQCFFGEHLLTKMPDSKVMIVESEKTAVICSHYYPQFAWLASGGCNGCLNSTAAQVLKGREVWLIPDLDAEDYWEKKLDMLKTITPNVGISRCISDIATPEQRAAKLDIADFLLNAEKARSSVEGAEPQANLLAEK